MADDSLWRVDLHIHTHYSRDGAVAPEKVVRTARRRGLARIAITDHNSVQGAREAQGLAPDFVIVGEEVKTQDGELLAYFIDETIPAGLSLEETVRRIREQGGIVGVPHPLDRLRREAIGAENLKRIAPLLDCLEVFNARVLFPSDNAHAQTFAQARGLPGTAGSDAHTAGEIGRAGVEVPPFQGAEEFLRALGEGKVFGRLSSPLVHLISTINKHRRPRV